MRAPIIPRAPREGLASVRNALWLRGAAAHYEPCRRARPAPSRSESSFAPAAPRTQPPRPHAPPTAVPLCPT
eukprot:7134136-Prymnesium_polylepis.1